MNIRPFYYLLFFLSFLLSCRDKNSTTKTPISGPGSPAVKNYSDATYLAKVYGSFVTENELHLIAIRKAKDQKVTALAKELLKSYEGLNMELEALAAAKHIALNPKLRFDQENHIGFLQQETSDTFDAEYLNILLREHKKFLEDFQLTGINSNDPEINTIAVRVLKVISKNYASITILQNQMRVPR